MSKKNGKFIVTSNDETADALESQGFTLINYSNGTYVYLNESPMKVNFNKLEKGTYAFTNTLHF